MGARTDNVYRASQLLASSKQLHQRIERLEISEKEFPNHDLRVAKGMFEHESFEHNQKPCQKLDFENYFGVIYKRFECVCLCVCEMGGPLGV